MTVESWSKPQRGCLAVIDRNINDDIDVSFFVIQSAILYPDADMVGNPVGAVGFDEPVFVLDVGETNGIRPWMKVITSHGIAFTRLLLFARM